jgi:hypothetical protein
LLMKRSRSRIGERLSFSFVSMSSSYLFRNEHAAKFFVAC